MDPAATPDLYFLQRPELIDALRHYSHSDETWDRAVPADLLEHAAAFPLTPEALAALAVARRALDVATTAMLDLDGALAALALALEAGTP